MIGEMLNRMVAAFGNIVGQALQGQAAAMAPVPGGEGRGGSRMQLNVKRFENLETFTGGEESWQVWSWKAKIAVSAMHEGLADLMKEVEKTEGEDAQTILARVVNDPEGRYNR